jgi:hypothetical protein
MTRMRDIGSRIPLEKEDNNNRPLIRKIISIKNQGIKDSSKIKFL